MQQLRFGLEASELSNIVGLADKDMKGARAPVPRDMDWYITLYGVSGSTVEETGIGSNPIAGNRSEQSRPGVAPT